MSTTTIAAKNLVAIVTGGAQGLGKATVQRLVNKGYKVGLLDLPVSEGQKVADELGAERVQFCPADIASHEQVKRAVDSVPDKFGHLNVVVNCAGIAFAQKLYSNTKREFMPLDRIERILDVNILGTLNVIQCSLPHLIDNEPDANDQRGLIVNTSSIAAYEGQGGQVLYAATKGAISSMTLPLARDYCKTGIRVMTIAPGLIDTPLLTSIPPKAKRFLETLVLCPHRLGKPDEFAATVEHIIDNPYLNGSVIRLDGGLRMSI